MASITFIAFIIVIFAANTIRFAPESILAFDLGPFPFAYLDLVVVPFAITLIRLKQLDPYPFHLHRE